MSLCFIEPQNAIRVIADSVGREARRQILGEVVRAWVDEIPEPELESHYAKAVADLDERMDLVPLSVDRDSEHGRGLRIVDSVASVWGVEPRQVGKAVWFELPIGM